MVQTRVRYDGSLHCEATHVPSGDRIATDAPVDNHGRGEAFSPTDLMAASLGTCVLTVMGIVAERHGWAFEGATATVEKTMVADPVRRIGELAVQVRVPGEFDETARKTLELTARTCPVHKSLHPDVACPIEIEWASSPSERPISG